MINSNYVEHFKNFGFVVVASSDLQAFSRLAAYNGLHYSRAIGSAAYTIYFV